MRYIKGGVAMCNASDLEIGQQFVHNNNRIWTVSTKSFSDDEGLTVNVICCSTIRRLNGNYKNEIHTFEFGAGVTIDLVAVAEAEFVVTYLDVDRLAFSIDTDAAKKLLGVFKLNLGQAAEIACILYEGVDFKDNKTNFIDYLNSTGTGVYIASKSEYQSITEVNKCEKYKIIKT